MPLRVSGNAASRISVLAIVLHNCARAALGSPFGSHPGLVAKSHHKNEGSPPSSLEFWYHLTISAILVLVGGVCAGCVEVLKALLQA